MQNNLLVELFGTFILSLVVLLSTSSATFFLPTPLLAGLVLLLFVYTIGGISGCHINPAVTIGLFSIKKITGSVALQYIFSQLLGAVLALILVGLVGVKIGLVTGGSMQSYFFEMLGMTIFTFGIASVVFDSQKNLVSGLIVGGSLLLGICISSLGGGAGVLNPAVAAALKTTQIGYYLAEIIGSIIGFQLYTFFISTPPVKKRLK